MDDKQFSNANQVVDVLYRNIRQNGGEASAKLDFSGLKKLPSIMDLTDNQAKEINADDGKFNYVTDALYKSLNSELPQGKKTENEGLLKTLADRGYPDAEYRYASFLDSRMKSSERYWGSAVNNEYAGETLRKAIKLADSMRGPTVLQKRKALTGDYGM